MKLTKAMFEQLEWYCDLVERNQMYYGNISQFEARHKKIVVWLNEQDPQQRTRRE